jgi:hypothetical protein
VESRDKDPGVNRGVEDRIDIADRVTHDDDLIGFAEHGTARLPEPNEHA